MKFKGPFNSASFSVGELVAHRLDVMDPYRGGIAEHTEERVQNLQTIVCAMAELMSPEQQIALVAFISPSHQPIQEK